MIDNKVEEFELIRSKPAAVEKFSEGALGGLPVEPYESAGAMQIIVSDR